MTAPVARLSLGLALVALSASAAQAHITIAPTQSMAGATEKYTLRVPREGKVATAAAEVDIAEGVILYLVSPLGGREHPGHGSKVVLGPLIEVTPNAIVIEVLDAGGGGTTRVRVQLQPDTRFRIDKERLNSLDGMIGQRAIVSVDWEDDDRGGQTLKATEVRFTRAKKK